MKRVLSLGLLCLLSFGAQAFTAAAPAKEPSSLKQGFQAPPSDVRPGVFYQVMGGSITKEGLTKDFEAMKRQGVGSIMLMQMPDQLGGVVHWPYRDYPGKIQCLSDEWYDIWNYAIGELDRLGMDFFTVPCPGWSHVGGPWVTPDKSGKILVGGRETLRGPRHFEGEIPRPPLAYEERKPTLPPWASDAEGWAKLKESYGDFYRDVALFAYPADAKPVRPEEMLDLTGKMDTRGRLTWDVPEGKWTVVRLGVESLKEPNYPAQLAGSGLECDRMDAEAIHLVFDNYVGRLLREAKAKGYKSFKGFDTDSYESVVQDFCVDFPEQFEERMGYDCTPWLPAWQDKKLIINSADLTKRFRHDMLRVISDLWLERFYGEIKEFAETNDVQWMVEAYFKAPIDWRTVAARSHMPGSEFWIREREGHGSVLIRDLIGPAPDAAALYGHKVVWAEAFTAGPENSAWRNDPWRLKPFGDATFCRGVNHFMMHGFVHNPFGNIKPGFSFGFWGTQFSRNVTWWPYSLSWHRYLARCHYMLQQGLPVADVLAYPPKVEPIPKRVLKCRPYKQTVCNDEALLERVSVEDGRLVLPHGVSYAALAIPPEGAHAQRSMTPKALAKLRDLVTAGATLIGEPVPLRSVSMQNYPACDQEMERLVSEIWGKAKVPARGQRKLGRGRVIWGRPLIEALDHVTGGPDFEFVGLSGAPPAGSPNPRYDFFHRSTEQAEIYFVANLDDAPIDETARFRFTGRKPELWDPVSGTVRSLPQYQEKNGHIAIPMRLAERQSCFVIFPQVAESKPQKDSKRNFPAATLAATLEGPWQVAFDPEWGGPEQVEFAQLDDWTQRPEPGIKYYSGTATYTKTFDAPASAVVKTTPAVYLDLGKVKNLAQVRFNGKDLGVVWCAPWRVEVTGLLRAEDNRLEIDVINTWVNRILGDEQIPGDAEYVEPGFANWPGGYIQGVNGRGLKDLPDWLINNEPRPSKRYTFFNWQFYPTDAPLMESGLMGPVQVIVEKLLPAGATRGQVSSTSR